MSTIFVGDVGTRIVLDCGLSVANAAVRKIIVRKPGGKKVEWVAQLEGTDAVSYVTGSGDIDTPGIWELQAYVELPSWKGFGEIAKLTVNRAL